LRPQILEEKLMLSRSIKKLGEERKRGLPEPGKKQRKKESRLHKTGEGRMI